MEEFSVFSVLTMLCGLSLFLFGMNIMGDALKRSAGNRLKDILSRMTSNPFKGFLLGLGATAIMQSSSATTVMVVGFVNSGAMTLSQSVGVILGANLGAAVTFWLTSLSGLSSGGLMWLSPDAWMPILALIGIGLLIFSGKNRRRDIAYILLGFSVLMVGMSVMSGAVEPLKADPAFGKVMTKFQNPVMGLLAGTILTAIIQSSGASVGILQSLSTTGAITVGTAIPIMLGQNIGTCITAILSSFGATKNGKRVAAMHLFFNVFSAVILLVVFELVDLLLAPVIFSSAINMWGVAGWQTVIKIVSILMFIPLPRVMLKIAEAVIPEKGKDTETNPLDTRLFATPTLAVESADALTCHMADVACDSLLSSIDLLKDYDAKTADLVRKEEEDADRLEDQLSSYLVDLSSVNMHPRDSRRITMLLHIVGDLERISDHSVNLVESAEEKRDKKIDFSPEAQKELAVLESAIREILSITHRAFAEKDLALAADVEPLEEVVDGLRDTIKLHHVLRLQKNECSIEHGFVLNDILTNFERVADHCSNIAGCLLEILHNDTMDMHRFLTAYKKDDQHFAEKYQEYSRKFEI